MKSKPILFSGLMVRALLEGRKSQTRRIMKQQPAYPDTHPPDAFQIESKLRHAPHKAGDEMWVRETWRTGSKLDDSSPSKIARRAVEAVRLEPSPHQANPFPPCVCGYRAWPLWAIEILRRCA